MSSTGRLSPGRLVVAIPTAGRPHVLAQTVAAITAQTRLPDLVLISPARPSDAAELAPEALPFPLRIVAGPPGLSRQRNRVMAEMGADDILLFLDDDFLMAPDYLAELEETFRKNPDVVMITGALIADGILGPGLDHAEGARLLAEGLARPAAPGLEPVPNGYGCNFALRMAPVLAHGLRFDERLPLYSWLEDVDFSVRLGRHGRLVRAHQLRGVHLGTKHGRSPGLRLGYSQIINPLYLLRKGTLDRRRASRLMLRNMAANLWRSLRPRPWADHRGRLRGNLLAWADVLRGRVEPERAARLGDQAAGAVVDSEVAAARSSR